MFVTARNQAGSSRPSTGLAPGTAHAFAVAALDGTGVSRPGPALTVRTASALQGPTPAQVLGHPEEGPDRPDLT